MADVDCPLLLADSIELSFGGRRILNGFALRALAGEITGLLGRNGCGKSSLLKVIFGSLNPTYQHIRIDNLVVKRAYRKRLVAYLPQQNFIPQHLTTRQIGKLYQLKNFDTICAASGIEAGRTLNELSGGQRRMVEILLIIHSPAPVVLLDEPFSHLAPVQVERLMETLKPAAKNKAIIITDHLYEPLLRIADKVMLMHNGSHYPIKNRDELVQFGYLAG